MAIHFNIEEDLKATEIALVDWKRRAKDYADRGMAVPPHIEARIEMLKKDATLLRQQMNGDNR